MKINMPRTRWVLPVALAAAWSLGSRAEAQDHDAFAFDGLTRHYLANPSPSDGDLPEVNSMAPIDFDGDGDADLVRIVVGSVELVENRDGAFFFRASVPLSGWGAPVAVASGDFDGDGHADFAVAGFRIGSTPPGLLVAFLGDGAGNFSPQPEIAIPGYLPNLVVADCDGDGEPDLVVSDLQSTEIEIVFANGSTARFDVGFAPSAAIANDLDGDGFPDLVLMRFANPGRTVEVRLNDGHGRFPTPVDYDGLGDCYDLL